MAAKLERRLGAVDAVVIGLGAMMGAGVFAAFGPAAHAAGNGLLFGLAIAGIVAYCNATSSARLAALYPESGGAYVYGRRRLGPFWGHLAGWGFVVGKVASCAAMAMTFGSYVAPSHERLLAIAAVCSLTTVNYFGVRKTALATYAIVAVVLLALATVLVAVAFGEAASSSRLWPVVGASPSGIFRAAGYCFFAFAGYARIATLGEEVRDPERTIPRAISIALSIAFCVYLFVGIAALAGAGASELANASAPLMVAVEKGKLAFLAPVVRVGAAVASAGVLLSLIAGLSRTILAMARNDDLPTFFAAVHPRHHVPHRAELAVGALVVMVVALADLRQAIGFSSFTVLTYYAVANAAAWTLGMRWVPAVGFLGCVVLAFTLPLDAVVAGASVLATGALLRSMRSHRRRR